MGWGRERKGWTRMVRERVTMNNKFREVVMEGRGKWGGVGRGREEQGGGVRE